MEVLPILQDGAPVLRETAAKVPAELFGTDKLRGIIASMAEALDREADGVAIAAPQVGIPYQIFLVRHDRILPPPAEGEPAHPADLGVFINPEITRLSQKGAVVDEGCLSVRHVYGKIKRRERATVRAQDIEGKTFTRGGGKILAQAYQHEIDHLHGILFIDNATDLKEIRERKDGGESDA